MEQPLVSIACITFNQAKYIRQCLDGFVKQKTTFPVEIVIHDDASTDGTQAIIMEYVEKYPQFQWKPILQQENQYSKGKGILVPFVYPKCTGKYIAFCEGDDYWTDPNKLSKQIDYLDNHPDCGMCYSFAHIFNQSKGRLEGIAGGLCDGFEDLIIGNKVPNLTTCFRNTIHLDYINEVCPYGKGWKMGDYPIWLWITTRYKIHCINEVMAVYRVLPESASHSQNIEKNKIFNQSVLDICMFFWEKYSGDEELKIKILDSYYRLNYDIGSRFGNWKFCLENILKIKDKRKRDYLRAALCWIKKTI